MEKHKAEHYLKNNNQLHVNLYTYINIRKNKITYSKTCSLVLEAIKSF